MQKFQDYLSYATVLEVHIGDPTQFTEDERYILLNKLYEVLCSNDELVYNLAWNLPELLLGYFNSDFDFNHGRLMYTTFAKPLLSIFALIAEKGNSKELLLKSLETLSQLTVQQNYSDFYAKGRKSQKKNTEDLEDTEGEEEESDIDEDEDLSEAEIDRKKAIAERYFDLKFVTLFELISNSLQKIQTSYPSRFLSTTTTTLLAFFASNLNDLSLHGVAFITRRLYLFARDYNPLPPSEGKPPVSEIDIQLQQKLLQSYLTFLLEMTFNMTSVSWSKRLYVELKQNVALETNPVKRARYYTLQNHSATFDDLMSRICQLALSFDMDVNPLFDDLVEEYVAKYDKQANGAKSATTAEYDENESETSTVQADSVPFDFQSSKTPETIHFSKEGVFLFVTQTRFSDRRNPSSPGFKKLEDLIKVTHGFLTDETSVGQGVRDALIFWALWSLRNIKTEEQLLEQVSNNEMLIEYMQLLSVMAQGSSERDFSQLCFGVISRLLSLSPHTLRFGYLIDTISSCPYEGVREISIKQLKDLLVPKKLSVKPAARVANAAATNPENLKATQSVKYDVQNSEKTGNKIVDALSDSINCISLSKTSDSDSGITTKDSNPEGFFNSTSSNVSGDPAKPALTEKEEEEIEMLIENALESAISSIAAQTKKLNAPKKEKKDLEVNDTEPTSSNNESDPMAVLRGLMQKFSQINEQFDLEDDTEPIEFGIISSWANFLVGVPLSLDLVKRLNSQYDDLVSRIIKFCEAKEALNEDNKNDIGSAGTWDDATGLKTQAELLNHILSSLKAKYQL